MFVVKLGISSVFALLYFNFIGADVGDSCFEQSDCGLWHWICDDFICKCDKEHIPDPENKNCVVDIEKPCGYHDTCYDPNAECVGVAIPKYGSCQCKKGFFLHAKRRVCSVIMGNACNKSSQCIEGQCVDKLCICSEPLEPNVNRTRCLPVLHQSCEGFNACSKENAICTKDKICECNTGYQETERNKTTLCLAGLGTTCVNTTDCADIRSECIFKFKGLNDKVCSCNRFSVRHPNKDICLKVATHPNDDCEEDVQCEMFSGTNSICKNKKCNCKSGYSFDQNVKKCIPNCKCPEYEDIIEIKEILKDLQPALRTLTDNKLLNISVLNRISNLKT